MTLIVDTLPAFFDVWLVGDAFLQKLDGTLQSNKFVRERNKKQAPTYLDEYFNTKVFYQASSEGELVMARVLNALTSAINQKDARLPKYLILLLDRDLINHVNVQDNFEEAANILYIIVPWFVKQVHNILHRKKAELWEKKPGAIEGCPTKVIFV